MPSVPAFSDISKPTNDLIGKDFPLGSTKLDLSTVAPNGLKITVNGNKSNMSNSFLSSIKAKYSDKSYGLTVTNTLTHNNVLSTQVEMNDAFTKGLKLDFSGNIQGSKSAKIAAEYSHDFSMTRATLQPFDSASLTADTVLRHNNFLIGGDVTYAISNERVDKYSVALGYINPTFTASLFAGNNLSTFTACYHQRVNDDLEAGAKAVFGKGKSSASIEVAAKYQLDRGSFVKAKVNNEGTLGLGYTFNLAAGLKLAVAGLFDANKMSTEANNVGFHITYEG